MKDLLEKISGLQEGSDAAKINRIKEDILKVLSDMQMLEKKLDKELAKADKAGLEIDDLEQHIAMSFPNIDSIKKMVERLK